MRELPPTLTTAPGIRLRHEHFGALAWHTEPRKIFQLDHETATLLLLHDQPRSTAAVVSMGDVLETPADECRAILGGLYQQGVLVAVDTPPVPFTDDDVRATASRQAKLTPTHAVLKPFWAHIQPFTRCNQHCIHCYCSGGPKADPFLLSVATWCDIVARLDRYGVFDVYVTGGESLLLDGFFDIAEAILDRGMGFGVSTNATLLSERILNRLRELRIGTVQVSLDGGNAALHEFIRGAPGSFTRTLDGIGRIAAFAEPVINTVVNRLNLDGLEEVVKLGLDHGCRRFKFFPQKPVGRSGRDLTLDDAEIMERLVAECARLADAHGVEIETIDPGRPCGSGSIGFALDQRADIYPCIFGIENTALCCGNLLADDLDTVWFGSPVLARFRGDVATPCRRCEP